MNDLRFAARLLAKDRRFTVAAVTALALAMGVNMSVFTLVNAALLRDLPFDEADRLVTISMSQARGPGAVSYPDFRDWVGSTTSFESLAAQMNSVVNVSEPDRAPERFRGAYVSADTLRVLRVTPILGRDFLPDDDRPGAPGVVILGHAAWQSRYGGDRAVIGRLVRVNDSPATIVGVMPPGFNFPMINELYQPLAVTPPLATPRRDVRVLSVIGRLAAGVELARARAEMETVVAALARQYPDTNREHVRVLVRPMREVYGRFGLPMLMTFMAAVALVLLVACATLANLLLARTGGRAREIAIRSSLGATRWRIVRQLLFECLLIAAPAAVLGGVLSIYGARTLAVGFDVIEPGAPASSTRPFWVDLSMDGWIVGFTGLLCVFATFACGLVPALHAARTNANDVLKEGRTAGAGWRARRWAGALIVVEIAVTLMLLAAAGLLWRSFVSRYRMDLVLDTSNVVTMRLGLPVTKYGTPESRLRFYSRLDERLSSAHSAVSAALAGVPPFDFGAAARELAIDARPTEPGVALPAVSAVQTGSGYFDAVKVPIVQGRALTAGDAIAGQEGAVVDRRFAETSFPDGAVLGRRIRLTPPNEASADVPWFTIVGVAATLPQFGPPHLVRPVVYVPLRTMPPQSPIAVVVRTASAAGPRLASIVATIRGHVGALDPDLPLYAIETLDAAIARARYPTRLVGTWFSIIALIALVLAAVGLYALTAQAVVQRTQEIGVRVAVGARVGEVLWLFARRAAVQLAAGLSLGVAGALASGRLLQTYLGDVSPRDPLTLVLVAALLLVVTAAASLIPARRATRVDPAVALRYE